MTFLFWIKVIAVGSLSAAVLSLVAAAIDQAIRPNRSLMIFDLTLLVYLVLGVIGLIGGAIVSITLLIGRSVVIGLFTALIVSVTTSIGTVRQVYENWTRPGYFDPGFFYPDLVAIALNMMLYPAVCLLVWKLFSARFRRAIV